MKNRSEIELNASSQALFSSKDIKPILQKTAASKLQNKQIQITANIQQLRKADFSQEKSYSRNNHWNSGS